MSSASSLLGTVELSFLFSWVLTVENVNAQIQFSFLFQQIKTLLNLLSNLMMHLKIGFK